MTPNFPVKAIRMTAKTPASPLWLRLGKRARAFSERALHGRRRRRARQQLRALTATGSVLFVCEGNIFRSPFAAGCFSAVISTRWPVSLRIGSAGFVGPDRATPAEAQEAARRRGIDLSQHRSTLLNGATIGEWDLIVVMEARQARAVVARFGVDHNRVLVLGDLDPEPIERRAITDPWSAPNELLEGSYDRVERCVRVLSELASTEWVAARAAANADSGRLADQASA
jgi:protein-tyrosine-phosphatase